MIEAVKHWLPQLADRPRLVLAIVGALTLLAIIGWICHTRVIRQAARHFYYVSRNTVALGWRDVFYWIFASIFAAMPWAFGKARGSDAQFHWGLFVGILLIFALLNAGKSVFESLSKAGEILRPTHGGVWRQNRKIQKAAILKKINVLATAPHPVPQATARQLITDILDVIASHVRDHRGNHDKVEVFASLLLVDGDDLVVVARDSNLADKDFKRDVPSRHRKTELAVCRAIESRRVIAVGDYQLEYPESPKNKPYKSILGLPILSSDDTAIVGVVSIDAARPYFFESFNPGATEKCARK